MAVRPRRTTTAAIALTTVASLASAGCADADSPSAPGAPQGGARSSQQAEGAGSASAGVPRIDAPRSSGSGTGRSGPRVRVLAVSVDGLSVQAIRRLGRGGAPALHRMLGHGAGTLNARTARETYVTLPNHTGMLTGRRVDADRGGHGVTWNHDRPGSTVHRAAGHRVGSIFSRVHGAGGRTALFAAKDKFSLFDRSWPIGRFVVDHDNADLVTAAIADLRPARRAFTFVHLSLPDAAGHAHGGMSPKYLAAVREADAQVGRMLRAVHSGPRLRRQVRVILTADHGFAPGRRAHDADRMGNYRIPFLVWGRSIRRADLYRINPEFRRPGRRQSDYRGRQPIRNAMLADLAADFLDLRSVRGSEFNHDQRLDVHR
ncbi:alkaline phosphatase family protein [Nocardioides insulae]|uniref:alkaline phosphatase family protein n=1 Tax=Nocardioides insulae TaxID=394734 RepID=UPI00146C3563|nr:alkaline phosphatase family protein [Nocardioides insulae]